MNKENFQKRFELLVKDRNLLFKMLIAIPRSNSSLIELVLASSSSITGIIHEPFREYGYYNLSLSSAYKNILSVVENYRRGTFLIKEMSHWLTKNNAHKRFLNFVDQPIIILIRNPLLNISSKIQKILESVNLKYRHDFIKFLSSFLLQDNKSYDIQTQKYLLDLFVSKYGYKDWYSCLKQEAFRKKNFIIFEPILHYFIENSTEDIWGWKSLTKIVSFLDKRNISYVIIDGIDFRLFPKLVSKHLCNTLGIEFNEDMTSLSKKNFDRLFNSIQTTNSSRVWYDDLIKRKKIKDPNEIPIALKNFPKSIKYYIEKEALPLYILFSSHKNRLNIFNCESCKISDRKKFEKYIKIDPLYYKVNKHIFSSLL